MSDEEIFYMLMLGNLTRICNNLVIHIMKDK